MFIIIYHVKSIRILLVSNDSSTILCPCKVKTRCWNASNNLISESLCGAQMTEPYSKGADMRHKACEVYPHI